MDKPGLFSVSTLNTCAVETSEQLEQLWPLLEWPEKPLPVMDVGCGPGDIAAKILAPRIPRNTMLVSCDISPKMIDYAKQHNAVPGVVTYELFDVETDDLQSSVVWKFRPYGKVFALLLLHWVPDNRCAIQNMNKLLIPGGEAIFTVIPKCTMFGVYEELATNSPWKDYMKDFQRFVSPYQHSEDPTGELKQLLEDEGFKVLYCWTGPREILYSTDDEVRYLLKSLNPFLERIPKEKKDDFIEEVLQRIYKLNGLKKEKDSVTGKEKIHYYYDYMVAMAKKL